MYNLIKKNKILFSFFLFIFLYNFIQIYEYAHDKYAFQYGDWLINYSNGFLRRGLIGEIFLIISKLTNLNLQIIFFLSLVLLILIFYTKNFLIFTKIKLNYLILSLLFSPFLFLFTILNHSSGIRKEYLLLVVFIFLITELIKKFNEKQLWKYIFIFQLLLLSHELSFFFLPYFILIFIYSSNKKNIKLIKKQIIILCFTSLFIFFLLYLFRGDSSYIAPLCKSFGSAAYNNCLQSGVVHMSFNQSVKSVFFTLLSWMDVKGFLSFLLIAIIYFSPFILFLNKKIKFETFNFEKFKINKKFTFILLFFVSTISYPLFLISFDWGRWLSILFFLNFYFIIFLILKKIMIFNEQLWFTKSINFNNFKKNISLIVIFLIYSTFATPGVFYQKDIHEKAINFNYYKIYKKFID